MSEAIRTLQPKELWNHFADLNAVPRASKKEERVIAFIRKFGEDLNLETSVDEVGNVLIKKPATPGMENRETVVIQSHLDMVHQKNADTDFNFDTQGIEMMVDNDWVKAEGTTLGADNGIGVAAIMSILASSDLQHPEIEALFTIDEETGMTGALGLKGGLLNAKIMLNLDTEDDRELTIGCAGGIDITGTGQYETVAIEQNMQGMKLQVKGLTGGHSGMDIHLGRGNANKLMNRVLHFIADKTSVAIASIDGGGLRNAIPRESQTVFACSDPTAVNDAVQSISNILKEEYRTTDPNLEILISPTDTPDQVMNGEFQTKFLNVIAGCPNGIYRMSPDIEDLVQTSNNVSRIELKNGNYSVQCLCRSSVDSEKMDEANVIKGLLSFINADVEFAGAYPGWTPNPDARIIKTMSDLYSELFDGDALVNACHAGLECGILGSNYPGMEMISFGPNIRGAHSPDEKVQISSVQKFWSYLEEALKRIPLKN